MNLWRRFLIGFAAVALSATLAGCGNQNSAGNTTSAATNSAGGARKLRIAVIPKMLDNPVFGYAHTGALRAAKQLGNVEILWDGPPKDDPAQQAQIVDSMVAQGVDAILITCANPDILKRPIDKAAAAGIPVITFDSDSPDSKRVAYYGVDDTKLGQRLGEDIARLLNGKGRVAILSGVQGALNLQRRDAGVRAALKKYPGITPLETQFCNDDLPRSVQIVSDVTRSQKPDGWVFVGGWPMFVKNGLNAIPIGKVKVVSVDPLPDTWHWIEEGRVQVVLGQKVFGWGEEGVKLAVKAINKEKLPTVNDSGFDVVTPQTFAAYKQQWDEMNKGVQS
ncbi:MAG TPA: substrate-binding domain-containing protein [Abditibacteriaceae bacterium]|jgi:ribose transport system substrate-binding protein